MASDDVSPTDEAGDQLQLHSYSGYDQHECSSVADVAEIPALKDRAKEDIQAEVDDTAALSLIGTRLGTPSLCSDCGSEENSIIHAISCLGEDAAA